MRNIKKQIVAIGLILLAMVSLAGCDNSEKMHMALLEEDLESMGFVLIDEKEGTSVSARHCYLVYDIETGIVYYLATTYNGAVTLCPRYDANGDIMIYEGGE